MACGDATSYRYFGRWATTSALSAREHNPPVDKRAALAAVLRSSPLGDKIGTVGGERGPGRPRGLRPNPWHAALASAVAFTIGATVPLAVIFLPPASARVPVTFVAGLLALALTGQISARLGRARPGRAVARVVISGALGMTVTYAIGHLFGAVGL